MINRGYSNVAYLEAALQCGTFRIGDPRLKNEAELLAEELMACEAEMVCDQKIAEELQHLLLSFTIVEEAAIRTVVPLISIVRLMHGSIKTKGNTSCVWQQSRLSAVLPNLPSDCSFIIINRRNKSGTKGKSIQFLNNLILF